MDADLGVFFLVFTLLLYKFTYLHARRPVPSAWVRESWLGDLALAGILLGGSLGFCFVLYFLSHLEVERFGVLDGAIVVVLVAVGWLGVHAIGRQWRAAGNAPPPPTVRVG
jgi:hypothetical protein